MQAARREKFISGLIRKNYSCYNSGLTGYAHWCNNGMTLLEVTNCFAFGDFLHEEVYI